MCEQYFYFVSERKCSRYQFECRSTGECIAIYNACDGIPQCADGSDEAPELGCPEVLTTLPPIPQQQNLPPASVISNQNVRKSVRINRYEWTTVKNE